MTRWEQTWAEAVLTAFVVDGSPGLNVKSGEVDYLSTLRRMRSGGTALAAFGLRAAVWMVATAPLWLLGRFVLFGTLGRAERTQLLSRLLSHNSFAVRDAAVDGLGIAQLPLLLARPELAAGRLRPVLADWHLPTVEVHAVFASARYLTPKVRAFIDLAVERFDG